MTKEELAALLDGREYGSEIAHEECELAKDSGLVVVFGYSDDNMEFDGAIRDEVGCWCGGVAHLDEAGLFRNKCDDEDCPYAAKERDKCMTIEALWHEGDGPCWTYETDIPHATFNIYEDGGLWCIGIVFEMDALRNRSGGQNV